ncbi:MAG: hypothetical protein WBW73_09000 [Rhodoplanes sp.]
MLKPPPEVVVAFPMSADVLAFCAKKFDAVMAVELAYGKTLAANERGGDCVGRANESEP